MPPALAGAIVWGVTGQAKVVNQLLISSGCNTLCLCDRDPRVQSPLNGVPIWHTEDAFLGWLGSRSTENLGFVAAIGGFHGDVRLTVHEYFATKGIDPIPLVHPSSWVDPTAFMGPGHQILAMAAIGVSSRLGRQCIVNTNATIDHDCHVGDGVHIMPGATIAGEVAVGDLAVVGSNATVLPHLTIGTAAIVGAGAVVTRDVLPGTTVVGVPARVVPGSRRRLIEGSNPWKTAWPR